MDISSLILVAVLNNPRDLEIARLLGWYRIPVRSAPKVVAVDYLAFYQTGAFGAEKWRIQITAPVRGVELTTRADLLKDELDHPYAQHEYYKIQLGEFEKQDRPILARKWRRITFFYTTGEYFLRARTIDDLIVDSEERSQLWRTLRERSSHDHSYQEDSLEPEVDPSILAVLLGLKHP